MLSYNTSLIFFSLFNFKVSALWVEEATNLAKILEDNPGEEEDNVALNNDALMQMAMRIMVLAQTYGINQLVNGLGTMFWGEMVSSTVLLASWHNVNISIYLQFTTDHIQLPVEKIICPKH